MKKMKYLIILLSLLTLLINVAMGMPPQVGINESNRNAQEKILGRVVDVEEAPLAWKNAIGTDHLTYFTLRIASVETTSSAIKKGDLIKFVSEYYVEPVVDMIGVSIQNLHKEEMVKVYANATLLRDEKGELIYMPVFGGYSIRPPDYEIPPGPPNQTIVERGNNNAEDIIIGVPLVDDPDVNISGMPISSVTDPKQMRREIELYDVGDMPSDPLEQIHGNVSQEIINTWTLNKTDGIHRMPDAFLQNINVIEPKWQNLLMLLYFNLKVEKVEKTSSGIKCGDTIKIAYMGYTYNNFGKEFYRLVNVKGKKVIKVYANATSIRNNEGELYYMPVFGGDSINSLVDIPQTIASISGKVTDSRQKPVSNATLIFNLNERDITSKTDENGKYIIKNITDICEKQFSVKVEADKYETQAKNISVKEGSNEVDFILMPKEESVNGFEISIGMIVVFMVSYIIKSKKL